MSSDVLQPVSREGMLTVSVVIPTHNRPTLLPYALASILNQTYEPLEVVVVDDASDDPSAYGAIDALRDPRVRWIRNDKALGASGARNRGVELARGDLVAFLDDDDEWLPEKLEKQVPEFVKDPEVGAVYCLNGWRDATGTTCHANPNDHHASGWIFPQELIADHTGPTGTLIARRECVRNVGGFDEILKAWNDWDLSIRLSEKYKIAFVYEEFVLGGFPAVPHDAPHISRNWQNKIAARKRIFEKYARQRKQQGVICRLKIVSKYLIDIGVLRWLLGQRIRGMGMYLLGMIVWPFSRASYARLIAYVRRRV